MKLALYKTQADQTVRPALITPRGVVDISAAVKLSYTPQLTMQGIIAQFDALRPALSALEETGAAVPLDSVQLTAPLPRPGKILCCIANYLEHGNKSAAERLPLNMYLKNPDAVIGPGDTIRLPEFTEPWIFMHEAELAIVFKGPSKMIKQADWRQAVFGYTGLIDVSARGEGRMTWKKGSWLGKSFDTFCPIGPCITTADEIPDPNHIHVRLWDDGQLRHDYSTDDMDHPVPELVEFATTIMTMNDGDLLACGTNHEGLGPIQDGETLDFELERIGRMSVNVADPLKRTWDRGVYMGKDSTNREAVLRHRPEILDKK